MGGQGWAGEIRAFSYEVCYSISLWLGDRV